MLGTGCRPPGTRSGVAPSIAIGAGGEKEEADVVSAIPSVVGKALITCRDP